MTAPHPQDEKKVPLRERYAVPVPMAAQFIGICTARVYELLKDGELDGRIVRGRRVVLVDSLIKVVDDSPTTKRGSPVTTG